jgi:hypothetical protein
VGDRTGSSVVGLVSKVEDLLPGFTPTIVQGSWGRGKDR